MHYSELEKSSEPHQMAVREPRVLRPDQPDAEWIALQNRDAQRRFEITEYVTKSRILATTLVLSGLTALAAFCRVISPYPVENMARETCQKVTPTLYQVSNEKGLPVYKTIEESTNPDNIIGRLPLGKRFGAVTVLTNRGTLTLSCEPGYLGMINPGSLIPIK